MATLIGKTALSGVQPRSLPTGMQMAYGVYTTISGTLAAGDIIQLVKIPNNARLISGFARISAWSTTSVAQINFGTRASQVGLKASIAGNAASITQFDGALLGELSTVTDSAVTRYTMIEALVGGVSLTGNATPTISIACVVTYQKDVSL